MKIASKLVFTSILLASSLAGAHGVERGSKFDGVLGARIQERIMRSIERSCDMRAVSFLEIKDVQVRNERLDQNDNDYYYTVTFNTQESISDGSTPSSKTIIVRAAEYAISNPTVDQYEIFSVKSDICNNDIVEL